MPRPVASRLVLSPKLQHQLQTLVRPGSTRHSLAFPCRLLLHAAAADNPTNQPVAEHLGCDSILSAKGANAWSCRPGQRPLGMLATGGMDQLARVRGLGRRSLEAPGPESGPWLEALEGSNLAFEALASCWWWRMSRRVSPSVGTHARGCQEARSTYPIYARPEPAQLRHPESLRSCETTSQSLTRKARAVHHPNDRP